MAYSAISTSLRAPVFSQMRAISFMKEIFVASIAFAAYSLMSVVTAAVYLLDKRLAIRGARRIPERTLHGLELLGGWPGALVAQQVFRHKNRKPSFFLVTWLIAASTGAKPGIGSVARKTSVVPLASPATRRSSCSTRRCR